MKEVDKLKKGDLGKKAEELLADSGWLPMPLRAKDAPAKAKVSKTPAVKKAATAAKKAPAKKVPAKKTAIKSAAVDASKSSTPVSKPGLDPAAAWPFPSNKY
jgi:DNA-binding protein HU-beta